MHADLRELMEQGVRERVFPGGVLLVRRGDRIIHHAAHGRRSIDPPAGRTTRGTCYDLASLTKVLATAPLVMDLVSRGRLRLGDRASRFLPGFRGRGRGRVTVRHLLEHSSGLAAWRPYHHEVAGAAGGAWLATGRGQDEVRRMVSAEQPEAPPGRRVLYSDLGFILLDWILERAGGRPLDVLFRERIAKRVAGCGLFFVDLKRPGKARAARRGRNFAATERCPWRGRVLLGEVHDDNAWAMGGVSGHAGLFGDAAGVAALACALLASNAGRASLFDRDLVRRFFRRSGVEGSTRGLGFDTPSEEDSSAGRRFGPLAVGHTGYTGTSLWMDPEREIVVVLLTNRVHPDRDNDAILAFRPRLHDLAVSAAEGA
jgi:CubicO group peptidase (beta-lactamase class C family)